MSNKRYRLQPNTNYWIFITDFRSCKIKWSYSAGEELFGLNSSKILGKSCCELIHGHDRPIFRCSKKVLNRNGCKKTLEFRYGKNRQKFLESLMPLVNENGEIEYIIHTIYPFIDKKFSAGTLNQLNRLNKIIIKKTILIAQKNEKLNCINSQLSGIERTNGNNKILRKISQEIGEAIKVDRNWEEFSLRFEDIHIGFYRYLLDFSLTSGQIRMCAFLYLNLNTKEIASMLCISPRGVEQMRYRIRKKLSIKKGENLNSFLLSNYSNHESGE